MSYRCHHGHLIQDSWEECPECCAEHDLIETTDAEQDVAEETRKQTEILEEMAYKSSKYSDTDQAQRKARFAEDRLRIDDLLGAVCLITEAIQINPQFISFYIQRARYFTLQGKKDKAIADLYHSFKADSEILVEFENRIKVGHLHEFVSLKPELEDIIREFKNSVRKTAQQSKEQVEAEIRKMRVEFPDKTLPDFVKEIESNFIEVVKLAQSDSYLDLVRVPKLAEETKKKAVEAIRESPRELMKKQVEEVLNSIKLTWRDKSDEADKLFSEADKLIEESRKYLGIDSLDSYSRALYLANEAKNKVSRANDLGYEAYSERAKIEKEERNQRELQDYRDKKSREYAGKFAGYGFLLGSLGGCVACSSGSGIGSFFGGMIIGVIGGALVGIFVGQRESLN